MGERKPIKNTTLVCIDNKQPNGGLSAILKCLSYCSFDSVMFFTNQTSFAYVVPDVVSVKPCYVSNLKDYSKFVMSDLNDHIQTEHVLICQHDGHILNPHAWSDDWYQWDYIGAPWWYKDNNVGNGGFSFRSKKFLEVSASLFTHLSTMGVPYYPEDEVLCRTWGAYMREQGIMFAPESVASRFSLERNGKFGHIWNGQFGFHNYETDLSKYYLDTFDLWRK